MRIIKEIYYFVLKVRGYIRFYFYKFYTPQNGVAKSYDNTQKIIVTMTSFLPRLNTLDVCIKTLLNQTKKPNKIVLYLGEDVTEMDIPKKLKKLEKYGLEIVTGCENIKPHKKYYFAMQDYRDDIIITVDDDVLYEKDVVESLFNAHIKFPNAVVCRRAREITRDENGVLIPYSKWPIVKSPVSTPTYKYLSTGVGGTLYPPNSVSYKAFDIEGIKRYCINADDIWLKANEVINNTPTLCIKTRYINPFQIPKTADSSLRRTNIVLNQNDVYIDNVQKYLNVNIDGEYIDKG